MKVKVLSLFVIVISIVLGQGGDLPIYFVSHAGEWDTLNPQAQGLYIQDSVVYLAELSTISGVVGGLSIINISNIYDPVEIGFCEVADSLPLWDAESGARRWEVEVQDNYAYLGASDSGLIIIDISDPTSPSIVGKWRGNIVNRIRLDLPNIYVGTPEGMFVLDVSDPVNPTTLSIFQPPDSLCAPIHPSLYQYITAIETISPDTLLVTSNTHTFLIANLSSPEIVDWKPFPNIDFTLYSTILCPLSGDNQFLICFYEGFGLLEIITGEIHFKFHGGSLFDSYIAAVYQDSLVICPYIPYGLWVTLIPQDSAEFISYGWAREVGAGFSLYAVLPYEFRTRATFNTQDLVIKDNYLLMAAEQAGMVILCLEDTTHVPETNRAGQNNIELYPNPTKRWIKINAPGTEEIILRDINGRVVAQCYTQEQLTIDIKNLIPSTGIYFMTFNPGGITEKIVLIK